MNLIVPGMEVLLIRYLYHGLLHFPSLTPAKPAYSLHVAFVDGSNPLIVNAYANYPRPSVGAGLFMD